MGSKTWLDDDNHIHWVCGGCGKEAVFHKTASPPVGWVHGYRTGPPTAAGSRTPSLENDLRCSGACWDAPPASPTSQEPTK